MSEHVTLSADHLELIKKAVRCPAKLIKSDVEKNFIKETKERLQKFGDELFVSEKQLSWLGKIAGRMESSPAKSSPEALDMPSYEDVEGD